MSTDPFGGPGPWQAGVRELQACLPLLPQQDFLRLMKVVCGIRELTAKISIRDQIRLGLCEWFRMFGGAFSDDRIRRVLEAMEKSLVFGTMERVFLRRHHEAPEFKQAGLQTYLFCLHELRYSFWEGQQAFWDIESEEYVTEMPQYGVTLFSCDMTGMYCRLWSRLNELRNRKDARPQPPVPSDAASVADAKGKPTPLGSGHQGDGARGGDVRDRPVRVVRGPLGTRKRR